MGKRNQQLALRIALTYGILAGLWILFSDRVMAVLVRDAATQAWLSTYKGWLFVLVSAWLLYAGTRKLFSEHAQEQMAHLQALEEINAQIMFQEERFREALKNSTMLVFSQDLDLRYTWFFNHLIEFPDEDVVGKTDLELWPAEYAQRVTSLKRRALETGESVRELMALKLKDRELHIELSLDPWRDASGEIQGLLGSAIDVSDLRLANRQVEKQLDRLTALRKIDLAITSSLNLQVSLDIMLDQARALLDLDAAAVLLLNEDSRKLEFTCGEGFRTALIRDSSLPLGSGLAGIVALERRGIGPEDLSRSEELLQAEMIQAEGFRQYYGLPLVAKGRVYGVLEVYNRKEREYNLDWLDFLEALAGQAAIAIDNMKLYEELQRSNVELSVAYDATLEGWSRALELRDQETDGHSQRVTQLALELAKALGVSENEMTHFRRGTLLHDIGKMGIPDQILLKAGPLDDDEWEIMRRHPTYAYEMLWPIRYLRPALDIPLFHHEHWDGSGYPRGLAGEEIPLAARIFTVVDVWDALLSNRPYRAAWPKDQVLLYMKEMAGKQFDPRVLDAFLHLIQKKNPRTDSNARSSDTV